MVLSLHSLLSTPPVERADPADPVQRKGRGGAEDVGPDAQRFDAMLPQPTPRPALPRNEAPRADERRSRPQKPETREETQQSDPAPERPGLSQEPTKKSAADECGTAPAQTTSGSSSEECGVSAKPAQDDSPGEECGVAPVVSTKSNVPVAEIPLTSVIKPVSESAAEAENATEDMLKQNLLAEMSQSATAEAGTIPSLTTRVESMPTAALPETPELPTGDVAIKSGTEVPEAVVVAAAAITPKGTGIAGPVQVATDGETDKGAALAGTTPETLAEIGSKPLPRSEFATPQAFGSAEAGKAGSARQEASSSSIKSVPDTGPRPIFAEWLQDFVSAQGALQRQVDPVSSLERALAGLPQPAQGGETLRPTPLQMLPIEIGMRAMRGVTSFQIRLDPAELGRVDVKLEIDEAGKVEANLVVDRVETLALLKRDASTLQMAFEQAGLKQSPDGLQFSLRGEGQKGEGQQERRHAPGWQGQQQDDALPVQNQIAEIAMRRMMIPNSSIDRIV